MIWSGSCQRSRSGPSSRPRSCGANSVPWRAPPGRRAPPEASTKRRPPPRLRRRSCATRRLSRRNVSRYASSGLAVGAETRLYSPPCYQNSSRSMLELIIKTSTDLPPDVRAAMKVALEPGTARTRGRGRPSTSSPQHRSGGRRRRARSARTPGMPDLRDPGAASAPTSSGWPTADPRRRGRGHQARQAAPELGRLHHRQELRQQPRAGHARHPLRAVGAGRDRGEAAAQGRRLREHERAVLACRCELAHLGRADRNLEGVRKCILHAVWQAQGKGCSPGRRRRLHRRRPRVGYAHAKEQLFRTLDDVNPEPELAELEATHHGHGQQARHRHDGVRRR